MLRYVLAPEADAGGTGGESSPAPAPETPASAPEAAPAPETPTTAPATPTEGPAPEGAPAGDEPAAAPEGEPAEGEGEAPPEDGLTDEDWEELWKRHPERDPRNIEARLKQQAEAEKAQKPETRRDADPLYQTVTQDGRAAYELLERAQQEFAENGYYDNPAEVAAASLVTGDWMATGERRGQVLLHRNLFEREVGIDGAKIDAVVYGDADIEGLNDFERQYAEIRTTLDREQLAAYRTQQSALAVLDPRKARGIVNTAMLRDAAAVGAFTHDVMKLAIEHGKELGRAEADKAANRRVEKVADRARRNGQTEAIAKARQAVAAGRANGVAGNGTAPSRTEKEILADPNTPVSELKEIRDRQRRGG